MDEFSQVAGKVNNFLRRNGIDRIDVTSTHIESEGSLRVEWKKGGRSQGEIMLGLDAASVHVARAILNGQSAEPLQKFGEQMHSFHEPRQQQSEIMLDL